MNQCLAGSDDDAIVARAIQRRDSTQRKRHLEELKKSREVFQDFLNDSPMHGGAAARDRAGA
eukprot:6796713-Pyramimonas_sp.AAC.1